MLTHGERHGSTGAMNLLGELHAGRGGADYQDTALAQLVRGVVVHRCQALDGSRHRLVKSRNTRQIAGTAGQDQASAAKVAGTGGNVIPVVSRPNGCDRCLRAYRRAARHGEARDELDHLGARHEAVGVGALITMTG